jgi:hypothetical protein
MADKQVGIRLRRGRVLAIRTAAYTREVRGRESHAGKVSLADPIFHRGSTTAGSYRHSGTLRDRHRASASSYADFR